MSILAEAIKSSECLGVQPLRDEDGRFNVDGSLLEPDMRRWLKAGQRRERRISFHSFNEAKYLKLPSFNSTKSSVVSANINVYMAFHLSFFPTFWALVATTLLFLTPINGSIPTQSSFPPLSNLEVVAAPSEPQPYILRSYSPAQSLSIGSQLYRFPVTGNSSGGAFSLVQTDAPSGNGALGVLPHIHEVHYENFYNFKGRFQLWTQKGGIDSGATGYLGPQESRVMLQGDFGAVPLNTTHTFQLLDPGTELMGVIVPGGFE